MISLFFRVLVGTFVGGLAMVLAISEWIGARKGQNRGRATKMDENYRYWKVYRAICGENAGFKDDFDYKKEVVQKIQPTLTPREKQVLWMRFGINEKSDHTVENVGQKFTVTRERIRQIEAKALRKLRHPSRSKKLKSAE
jgi:DNA-directed RNA polymerase specialized sigma subunit